MLRIKPFGALRPMAEHVEEVASPPYDVVDREEAREIAKHNPYSFLHVTRPDIDLPDDTDPYADVVYKRAAQALNDMRHQGLLEREVGNRIYLYRQEAELLGERRSQIGVVCCCHIDDYNSGLIKKHEKTRKAKEDDRTRHVLETNANTGPVFLMRHDQPEIDALIVQDIKKDPLFDFTAPDGVRHTVWWAEDNRAYQEAFGRLPAAYVADGHHRTASAARAAAQRRDDNPNHTGDEEYNWFLAAIFPASSLTILPYHRVVADLAGMSADQLIERLGAVGQVEAMQEGEDPVPAETGRLGVYVGGKWWRVIYAPESIDRADPVASLDYQLLSDRVLDPILGIADIRTDARIDFVGGIRGAGELAQRVDSGRAAVAFAMPAVAIDQIMAVADAERIMPPKSTWFEPKLRSGLLIHTLD